MIGEIEKVVKDLQKKLKRIYDEDQTWKNCDNDPKYGNWDPEYYEGYIEGLLHAKSIINKGGK